MTVKRNHSDEEIRLHELFEPEDELDIGEAAEDGDRIRRPAWLLRLAAAFALIAFVVFSYAWLPLLSPAHFQFLSQDRELSKESLVKSGKPAVVSIRTVLAEGMPGASRAGTGFNIDSHGLVVTNRHVIEGASSIEIAFPSQRRFYTKDYRIIPGYDLALIRLNAQKLPVLPVSYQVPAVGDEVTIIGNPRGYRQIAARGLVQGYYAGGKDGDMVLAISAIAEPGSSGSPVLNGKGEAEGIVYAITKLTEKGQEVRYSLAIPAAYIKPYIRDAH